MTSLDEKLREYLRVVRTDATGRARIEGRKIYILPTGYGLLFGLLLVLLLIGSINYANNPAFLLTFLLTGLYLHAIFHTWRNLLGVEVQWLSASPVFAGQKTNLKFQLGDPDQRGHWSVQLSLSGESPSITDVHPGSNPEITLFHKTVHRGWLDPGRLTIETRYPLGLLRAWSYLQPAVKVIVYPTPADNMVSLDYPDYEGTFSGDKGKGADDFVGHRGYHPGDQPKHMNWKAFASDKGLLIKQFGGDRMERVWLDYAEMPSADPETKIRLLTRAVIELSSDSIQFGLRLPDQEIPPASGQLHEHNCLQSLALFGLE